MLVKELDDVSDSSTDATKSESEVLFHSDEDLELPLSYPKILVGESESSLPAAATVSFYRSLSSSSTTIGLSRVLPFWASLPSALSSI